LKATTAEHGQETEAAEEDGRADKPRVGDLRGQFTMRRPPAAGTARSSPLLPGRGADDRSSRPARAVAAYVPRDTGFVVAETEPAVASPRDDVGVRDTTSDGLAYEGATRTTTRAARRALHGEAVALIAREYATDLRLADVARRIGASTRALQRAFADHGELSFSQELRATRLNAAAQLLRTTNLPVGAIASRVGYHAHPPFTKAFRRHHGTSPRTHRAESRVP
jgi:AraC-like DNA-binding protein